MHINNSWTIAAHELSVFPIYDADSKGHRVRTTQIKKADGKNADDFIIEISISKNSLPQSSDLYVLAGLSNCIYEGAKVEALKQVISTPSLRGFANERNISETTALFEERISRWNKNPIVGELNFWLFVLTQLPHETSKNNLYYVIEENGKLKIHFSEHNALAKYLNKNLGTDLCKWADIKKASCWLSNHVSNVHAVGLSTKRIANVIKSFAEYQFFDSKNDVITEKMNGFADKFKEMSANLHLTSYKIIKRYSMFHGKAFTVERKQQAHRLLKSLQLAISDLKIRKTDPLRKGNQRYSGQFDSQLLQHCQEDIQKAFSWLANHVCNLHAVGLSTKRIASISK